MSAESKRGSGERAWVVGAAVVALVVIVVGWFFLISPQRSDTAEIDGQTADAQTQNLALRARMNVLSTESKNKSRYSAALAQARRSLPDSSDLSTFIRDVQAVASRTSTRITALAVEDANVFTAPGVGSTASAAIAPAATPTTAPSAGATPQAGATSTASGTGLIGIGMSASITGRPDDLSAFVRGLQEGQPRAVLIVEATRNAIAGGEAVLQLKMGVFAAPAGSSADVSAATAAPATPSPGG